MRLDLPQARPDRGLGDAGADAAAERGARMKRREFLASIGFGALVPAAALAQPVGTSAWTLFDRIKPSTSTMAYSRDGRLIATGTGGIIRIWIAQTGEQIQEIVYNETPAEDVDALAFHPDGRQLLGGGTGPKHRNLRLWEIETGQELRRYEGLGIGPLSIAYNADASRIVAGGNDNTVRVWDALTGRQIMAHGAKGPMHFACFLGDGSRVLAAGLDLFVRIYDAETGLPTRTLAPTGARYRCGALSPDGQLLALGGTRGAAYLFDLDSGAVLQRLVTGSGSVRALAFTPDGARLLTGDSGSDRSAVELWDVASGKRLWVQEQKISFGMGGVSTLALNPLGDSFAVSIFPEGVQIWPTPEAAQ
ncbi:WD40 repeat domain-containing protein [Tropicibacter oceani]